MSTNTKTIRATQVRTSASLPSPDFAGTTFLKSQLATSPSKADQYWSAKQEPKREQGTFTTHPLRVITSLKSIVESHSNVPGSIHSFSASTCPHRNLRWRVRQHTLAEMIVFVAFIFASVTLFSALAGIGYVSNEPDQFVSGLRAPELDVIPDGMTSEPSIFERPLQQIGPGGKAMFTEDNEVEVLLYRDEEEYLPRLARGSFHRRPYFVAPQEVLRHVHGSSYMNRPQRVEDLSQTYEQQTSLSGQDQQI